MSLREALQHSFDVCHQDENFMEYNAREQFLAFVFTYIQTLEKERAKFIPILQSRNNFIMMNSEVKNLSIDFSNYANNVIDYGKQTGEIIDRPFVGRYYEKTLWLCLLQILNFWSRDNSNNKEETDVIIEKSVHFTFDLFLPNAIDSGIDYVQFLIQKR